MKQIYFQRTLLYYEVPVIFEARDSIGGHYIASAVKSENGHDRHLLVGVSPEGLRDFKSGSIDLRSITINSIVEDRYLALTDDISPDEPLSLIQQINLETIEEEYLPSPGLLLYDEIAENKLISEARERGAVILKLSARPPEEKIENQIKASTIGRIITNVQLMVKNAYSTYADRTNDDSGTLYLLTKPSPGSVEILLGTTEKQRNMFEQENMFKTLELIDSLFHNTENPKAIIDNLKKVPSKLSRSYMKTIEILNSQKTGLSYSWAGPDSKASRSTTVRHEQAGEIIKQYKKEPIKSVEKASFEGRLELVNVKTGRWGLLTEEGMKTGKTKSNQLSLGGLIMDKAYMFHCEEEYVDFDIPPVRYLINHEEV